VGDKVTIDPRWLGEQVRSATTDIAYFVNTEEFQSLLAELYSKPVSERHDFVRNVIINKDELATRGISVPDGMTVQRSAFADGRPTLFCVTKYLPGGKRKVTITFDNPEGGPSTTADPWAEHLLNEARLLSERT
jgi:hypothetical protein